MKYKKELTELHGASVELEFWVDLKEVEHQINVLEMKFKETFYNLKLFKFDKSREIILNLSSVMSRSMTDVLLPKYHKLSKELNDVKLEISSYLKKKANLKVIQDAIDSDFVTQVTKYKTYEDLIYADRTYLYILDKKIKTYLYTFRQLKNICFIILKNKRNESNIVTSQTMKLSEFIRKNKKELNYVKNFLKDKGINITNIVIRGDVDGTYVNYHVYVDKEQYNVELTRAIWYLLQLEFKKGYPSVLIESSEDYILSPFSVDVTNDVK